MDERTVITIGREFGSGGHEIGMKLAEKLGIKCYDKELLQVAAKVNSCARSSAAPMSFCRRTPAFSGISTCVFCSATISCVRTKR